jgi:hypothetical protein
MFFLGKSVNIPENSYRIPLTDVDVSPQLFFSNLHLTPRADVVLVTHYALSNLR